MEYINSTDTQPTFVARYNKRIAGFLTLKKHNAKSWEIYVMGVYPKYHRQGIGAQLIKCAEDFLRAGSCQYVQVKTLGPSHNDINYAKTRKFYFSQGYIPLEEFKELWDPASPCLLLVKKL
ncbi:MAG: GNAT family N-acetyltransferase [Candidatus Marinimicrobia bacterium]|nr:GNAT family N-acetyltransferase [Candidatus Neomarinimicrobiota bacterium]MBT3683896.1 GNAT family N-acetyltransferase [Candidatus Neomarinimicrobiota bacterium]MBT3759711.1 GNAT family N-acetyltransferase [Candidatus Neomarinimicrobiota bacterium]MBT3895883.1 GNAT family N-acetyltransferase [Candidatus Neomarinimicrobiota bacterium]MBT4173098.1 GNAT family N-acetyltransferase [Candidatus Neomarinimicrobiota bacterium]